MSLAATISALAGIFGLAFFWFWGAIPAGVALGLPTLLVTLTVWLSYVVGVVAVVLLGEPIRARLMAKFSSRQGDKPDSPIRRIWDRFGLIGLSLLAPMTVGSQGGAALGLTLGVPPRRLIVGMAFGAAVWAIGITIAVILGATVVNGAR